MVSRDSHKVKIPGSIPGPATNYKSYREQSIECDKNGNRIEVMCPMCTHIVLVCKKYNDYCHSKACLKERIKQ